MAQRNVWLSPSFRVGIGVCAGEGDISLEDVPRAWPMPRWNVSSVAPLSARSDVDEVEELLTEDS